MEVGGGCCIGTRNCNLKPLLYQPAMSLRVDIVFVVKNGFKLPICFALNYLASRTRSWPMLIPLSVKTKPRCFRSCRADYVLWSDPFKLTLIISNCSESASLQVIR